MNEMKQHIVKLEEEISVYKTNGAGQSPKASPTLSPTSKARPANLD